MKKILLFTAVVFLSSYSVSAQKKCLDCVRAVYQEIFAKNLSVIELCGDEYPTAPLCLGCSKSQIEAAIDNAKIYSYGSLLDSIVEINLNPQVLFFSVSVEGPSVVLDIYDSNGIHILCRNDTLHFPAIINDPDGYVNIRKEKNAHSPIVGKIKRNQVFFFTPSGTCDWYWVSLIGTRKFRGYVHKSRILPYEKCPEDIREEMEEIMFC